MRYRALALGAANAVSLFWRVLPFRRQILTGLLVLESRASEPRTGLRRLFAVRDTLDLVINERAMALGNGVHPKHRLNPYHQFFIDRVDPQERVLDVGCGIGMVARSIARARPQAAVVGIDYDEGRLSQARAADNPGNLSFVLGDATRSVPDGGFSVVVLSNVLEHIVDRTALLKAIAATTGAQRFLIRVPHFERDWQMPLRRELGVNYYSDPDHKIEHTTAEFRAEMAEAGLAIAELQTPWGEIWADCRVRDTDGGARQ